MKKPEALIQLLEELRGENIESPVEVIRESKAVIYPSDEAANDDDGIALNAEDCRLAFSSENAIERLMEAIGEAPDASLALFDISLPGHMQDLLERRFNAVDEG